MYAVVNNRLDAIYGRQSVDRQDSISIESQLEFCRYELKGGTCKEYTDKGYSGKNIDRPQFQQLVKDIERGLIKRVIVYKLDRISRSIIDFSNMMELFQRYNVEFVSSTEKFDTSTPMGRAMLNICIVFAQLERETIQKRVTDAYYSRCQKGFHMGGPTPYGFTLEPFVMEGINTKKMIPQPEAAERVKMMFDMYAEPQTSLGDIVRHFLENGLDFGKKQLCRQNLANILGNPIYAQADTEMYEFFKNQGAVVTNDAADFAGVNGCYSYKGRDTTPQGGRYDLTDHILVVAPHEGLIPSDTWLTCRQKLMKNTDFGGGGQKKAKNTWLSGKAKCGVCGSNLMYVPSPGGKGYFRCRKRADSKACPGAGTIKVTDVEDFIYTRMCERMSQFQSISNDSTAKANPKLTALNVERLQVESEIEKLLDTLTGANATLLAYANKKIEELDEKRQSITKAIADLSADIVSPEQIEKLSNYLYNWDNISFEDRRQVADGLITNMSINTNAEKHKLQVAWKL